MPKILLSFFLWILLIPVSVAQYRQMSFKVDGYNIALYESKADPSGNIISVGQLVPLNSFFGTKSIVIKSDKAGNILWSRTCLETKMSSIKFAANGDYLIHLKTMRGILRMDSSGNFKWLRWINYFSNFLDGSSGIAELPNGNIIIAGTNHFFNTGLGRLHQGVLTSFDSAGNFLWTKWYGHNPNTFIQYHINDLAVTNDKILLVGGCEIAHKKHGIFIETDFNGNLLRNNIIKYTNTNYPQDSLDQITLNSITLKNNKIFVSGHIETGTPPWGGYMRKQLIGFLDTINGYFTGYQITNGDSITNNPVMAVGDQDEFYIAFNPINERFLRTNRYLTSRIANGVATYNKLVTLDTVIDIGSVTASGDTIVIAGGCMGGPSIGYFSYFNRNSIDIGCNVQNTTLLIDTFFKPLQIPTLIDVIVPAISSLPSTFIFNADSAYEIQLCGDTVCSPLFHAQIDTLTATAAVEGDTILLYSPNIEDKTWFRNDTALAVKTNILKVITGGMYKVAVVNYLECKDTSREINVSFWPLDVSTTLPSHDFLSVYPNPATGILIVETKDKQPNTNITLSTISGRKLITQERCNKTTKLDISSIPPGLYLLNYHSDVTNKTIKILKE